MGKHNRAREVRHLYGGRFLERGLFLGDLLSGREPLRSAGFSPQGRPLSPVCSCGLKSALRARFMESGAAARPEPRPAGPRFMRGNSSWPRP